MALTLDDLTAGCSLTAVHGDLHREMEGVTSDSRKVEKGFLFAAIKGTECDGHDFVDAALGRGAAAVIAAPGRVSLGGFPEKTVLLEAENPRRVYGEIAARYYGTPSEKLALVGITGTNGKTTTAYILESIFKAAGFSPGIIGTVNYRYGGQSFEAPNTTPEPAELQRLLAEMAAAGTTHCVMEVSSHALDQERVAGCRFETALFTNLTQDHLDYHLSMEAYGAAKARLFREVLSRGKRAVVNIDDPFGDELAGELDNPLTYGFDSGQLRSGQFSESPDGIKGVIKTPNGSLSIESPLIGRHNFYNIMAAAGVAAVLGIEDGAVEKGIRDFDRVPGRLERVALPDSFSGCRVFVDYAHTPDALERVIAALRPTTEGRLITLFGCGGNRDREKRPLMGEIAVRGSDYTIITSDNPRKEEPLAIIADVEKGAKAGGGEKGGNYSIIADRREAICAAAGFVNPGDTLLIAGKGHEDYQIVGDKKNHFDDREEALIAFGEAGAQAVTA